MTLIDQDRTADHQDRAVHQNRTVNQNRTVHQNRFVAAEWLQVCAAGFRALTGVAGQRQSVITAVQQDPDLTMQQREALEELYSAFREINREHRRSTN